MAAESCPEIAGDKKMGGEKHVKTPPTVGIWWDLIHNIFNGSESGGSTLSTPQSGYFNRNMVRTGFYWDSILASDSGLPRAVEKFTIQHYAQVIKHGNEHSSIYRRSWNEVPQIINALMLMAVNDSLHW